MKKATPRQEAITAFARAFHAEHGEWPRTPDVAKHLQMPHGPTRRALIEMDFKGLIEYDGTIALKTIEPMSREHCHEVLKRIYPDSDVGIFIVGFEMGWRAAVMEYKAAREPQSLKK